MGDVRRLVFSLESLSPGNCSCHSIVCCTVASFAHSSPTASVLPPLIASSIQPSSALSSHSRFDHPSLHLPSMILSPLTGPHPHHHFPSPESPFPCTSSPSPLPLPFPPLHRTVSEGCLSLVGHRMSVPTATGTAPLEEVTLDEVTLAMGVEEEEEMEALEAVKLEAPAEEEAPLDEPLSSLPSCHAQLWTPHSFLTPHLLLRVVI